MSKVITSENVNAFVELVKTQNKLAKYTRVSHVRDQLIVVELGFLNKETNVGMLEYSAWVKTHGEKLELWLTGELCQESPNGIVGFNVTKEDHYIVLDDDWYVRAVIDDAFDLVNHDNTVVNKIMTRTINAAGYHTQEQHDNNAQAALDSEFI